MDFREELNEERKIKLGYVGSVNSDCEIDVADLIKLLKNAKLKKDKDPHKFYNASYEKITYDDDEYMIFKYPSKIDIYKFIPLVENNETFNWKPYLRAGHKTLQAIVNTKNPNIYFTCTYRMKDGSGMISMTYDNGFDKNTIARKSILKNATNEKMIEKMNSMMNHLLMSVMAA